MATPFDQRNGDDRQRFIAATDYLIAALENMRNDSALRPIRGDLHELQDKVQHTRRVVECQPNRGRWPWVFAVTMCLCPIVDTFPALAHGLTA
jgi:hypothetical protein